MVSQTVTLTNAEGFHMRPAGVFAAKMSQYVSTVKVKHNGNEFNGKSLMSIMSACIKCGNSVEIICSGNDEESALGHAVEIIENGFDV